jgi:hypothetical protein
MLSANGSRAHPAINTGTPEPLERDQRSEHSESWLLVKGESTRHSAPSVQFPDIARKITSGPLRAYFQGPGHCSGCASILAAAGGAPKLGSAEAWRRLGTIHHMTMVVSDLGALAWP